MKYIPTDSTIWCPFDTEESWFVKRFRERGNVVVATSLITGQDFFDTPPPMWCDYIISNPPFSKKNEILDRLFQLKIPFAILIDINGMFDNKKRFNLFKENKFEIMYLDKRVAYFTDYDNQILQGSPPYSSVYICSGILPEQIIFEEINKT